MPIDWPEPPPHGKLQHRPGDTWIDYLPPAIYCIDDMPSGGQRLRSVAPGGDGAVFGKLTACLEAPLVLLYVLHTDVLHLSVTFSLICSANAFVFSVSSAAES